MPEILTFGSIKSTTDIEIDVVATSPSDLKISKLTEYSPGDSHFAFAVVESINPMFSMSQLKFSI